MVSAAARRKFNDKSVAEEGRDESRAQAEAGHESRATSRKWIFLFTGRALGVRGCTITGSSVSSIGVDLHSGTYIRLLY